MYVSARCACACMAHRLHAQTTVAPHPRRQPPLISLSHSPTSRHAGGHPQWPPSLLLVMWARLFATAATHVARRHAVYQPRRAATAAGWLCIAGHRFAADPTAPTPFAADPTAPNPPFWLAFWLAGAARLWRSALGVWLRAAVVRRRPELRLRAARLQRAARVHSPYT